MDKANILLNSLSEEEITLFTANPETEEHIVIDEYRVVTVPESLKRIAVQHDSRIETVTFDCPRYWDDHDMSQMVIYINYLPVNGTVGSTIATNIVVDEEDPNIMHFDWTIMEGATSKEGTLTFLVDIKGSDGEHWHSELNREMYVSEGIEPPEIIPIGNPDVLTQVLLFNASVTELNKTTLERAAVYVGSGIMPDGYNVQVDPNGTGPGVFMYAYEIEHVNAGHPTPISANRMTIIDGVDTMTSFPIMLYRGVEGLHNEWDFQITTGAETTFTGDLIFMAYDMALGETIPVRWGQINSAPTFSPGTTTLCRMYYIGDTLCGEWVTV